MANTVGERESGGGGGIIAVSPNGGFLLSPVLEAARLAAELDKLTKRFQGTYWAEVMDTTYQDDGGFVSAIIGGGSEVRVICGTGAGLSVGDDIRIRRMSPDPNSYWEYVGADTGGGGTEYALCFGDPANNTVGSVYVNWGGTISSVQTEGTGTVALTVSGVAVDVGSTLTSGTWLVATVSGGSGTYFSVAVMVA